MTAGTSPAPGGPSTGTVDVTSADAPVPANTGTGHRVFNWFETRLGARQLFDALMHVHIPISARTFFFGGITMFLFIVQVVTGSLLALYYKPTPEAAYESVVFITSEVTFGWLIRSIHHWAANLMIVFLILHVVRIFFQASYKYPREITWLVGGGLLGVTIFFGFTGYLLPWDQRAYWATVVGTEIAGFVPIIGDFLLQLLRGGTEISGATLSRFYGIHVLFLPLALGVLLVVHLTLVHQQGLANRGHKEPRPYWPDGVKEGEEPVVATAAGAAVTAAMPGGGVSTAEWNVTMAEGPAGEVASAVLEAPVAGEPSAAEAAQEPKRRTLPFFPDYILDEVIAWYFILGVLVVMASIFPAGIEEPANPLETPEHIKPEWYFLAVYELLKWVPKVVGVIGPMVALAILVFLPFIDRNPEVKARRRRFAIALGVGSIALFILLTIRGYYS